MENRIYMKDMENPTPEEREKFRREKEREAEGGRKGNEQPYVGKQKKSE